MFNVNDFLDRAKAGANVTSDYALAVKVLGYGEQSKVTNWRKGRSYPDGRAVLALCRLSGDDPEHVVACLQSMRAANDDEAQLWQRVADRIAGGAHVLLLSFLALILGATALGWTDEAAASLSSPAGGSLYIMLSGLAVLRLCYRLGVKHFSQGRRIAHP